MVIFRLLVNQCWNVADTWEEGQALVRIALCCCPNVCVGTFSNLRLLYLKSYKQTGIGGVRLPVKLIHRIEREKPVFHTRRNLEKWIRNLLREAGRILQVSEEQSEVGVGLLTPHRAFGCRDEAHELSDSLFIH